MKNKNVFTLLTMSLLCTFVVSCAHHRDVRPSADGVHRVVVATDDTDEGSREAIAQANHFCEKRGNKTAAFVDENSKYSGDMDEKSYKKAKKTAKVAKAVGGMAHVFGGKNESAVGGIVGLGGIAGDAALGNSYKVEMKFKCM